MLSIHISGCRSMFQKNPQKGDNETQLHNITDGQYSLYLSEYNKDKSYEFIVCHTKEDITTTNNSENKNSPRVLPKQCVSAFRSAPIFEVCELYQKNQMICSQTKELQNFCTNYTKDSSITPPLGLDPSDCPLLASYNVLDQCQTMTSSLENTCQNLQQHEEACTQSNSPYSESCSQLTDVSKQRTPFVLYDLSLSAGNNFVLQKQLEHEKFLVYKHNRNFQRWEAFITGASFSMFSTEMFRSLKKIMPAGSLFTQGPKIFFGRGGRANLSNILAISGQFTGFSLLEGSSIQQLFSYYGYTEAGACMLSKMQQIPMPITERNSSFAGALKRAAIPFVAGSTMASIVAKATHKLHPAINIGAITAVPFVAAILSKHSSQNSSQNTAPAEVMALYKNITTPTEDITDSSSRPSKVSSIENILPVLARSMLVTGKTSLTGLDEYCMPKKEGDNYTASCKPVFDATKQEIVPSGNQELMTSVDASIDCS